VYHNGNLVCADQDGPATQVEVCEITGLAYSGPELRLLYMADNWGSLVRQFDLNNGTVKTVAGEWVSLWSLEGSK